MKANTESESFDLTQIPLCALKRIGQVFREGEAKYGKDNWQNGIGDFAYQRERANHAIKHLYEWLQHKLEGTPLSEDALAKVAWFCVTQMWLEKEEEYLNVHMPTL